MNKLSSGALLLSVACLFFAVPPSLKAQTNATGALSGIVTDSSGAVVPNVTVTVTSTDTGQARTTTTGADGSYNFGLLSPGPYRVKFEATGFKAVEIPSAAVAVTETATLNQRLEVGSQSQEVTVQGNVETVQTSNATVGTVMTSQTVAAIPLTTRNYTNLLGLSAGANVGVFNAATLGKGTQDIAVNGSSTNQNNFQMDGASIVAIATHGTAIDAGSAPGIGIANPDAIQEFKIQTSLYDAGYGRTPGANVNVVTKSGTNAFHGTAFEFFRNTDLNANDYFRKISPPVNGVLNDGRQVLNQNQFGGVFGGPIKKDKLFFFASYQETRQNKRDCVRRLLCSHSASNTDGRPLEHCSVPGRFGGGVLPDGDRGWQNYEWRDSGGLQRIEYQSRGHQCSPTEESRWHLLRYWRK